MAVELLKEDLLQKLGNERKARDRATVFHVIWVKVVLSSREDEEYVCAWVE